MRGAKEIETARTGDGGESRQAPAGGSSRARTQMKLKPEKLVLLLIVAVTAVAYGKVLFNFFAGDDFVHLTWLKQAIVQPELIWRNFHSSWLDGTTTKFYRPLISVFMVTDYLVWGINGLGFHLTNLFFHIVASVCVFLIADEVVPKQQEGTSSFKFWPVAACAMFALYPLHPEAVSWITGRVDAIVTAFSLLSIWCYLRYRRSSALGWLAASLLTFVLALMSKEMAVTVPCVVVAYEFFIGGRASLRSDRPYGSFAVRAFLNTLAFWVVLAGYFVVRQFALGTFVGGYDDSLTFIADPKAFILNWAHALRMTVVPLNKELFGAHNLLTKVWEVMLAASVVSSIVSFIKNKQYRGAVLFFAAWLVLALVPVYKIFAISDDLQGSRLAYLATVPLSALLTFGFATIFSSPLRASIIVAVSALAFMGLSYNNVPWQQAGLEANAIRAGLESIYKDVSGDPQTLLIGLPDQVHGAYVCRNAIPGMTSRPQLSKDVANCLMINEFDPVQPFGFLKDSLAENRDRIRVFQWVSGGGVFRQIMLPEPGALKSAVSLKELGAMVTLPSDKRPSQGFFSESMPCWNMDFVKVDLNVADPGQTSVGADLLYANDVTPMFQLSHRTHADIQPQTGKQSLVFSLRCLPEWSFGTSAAKLKLMLPPGFKGTVDSVTVVPQAVLLPRLSFTNSGYMGTKGYLHLGKSAPAGTISVDASNIPDTAKVELEITRANLLFEEQNGKRFSKVAQYKGILCPIKGSITLHAAADGFKSPGIYEARLWAEDAAGKVVGVASDHIVLSVDP